MRKKMLSLLCVLALCLGLLPVTALAAENAPTTLYVGGQSLPVVQDSYWTTNENGKLTTCNATKNWNVAYDAGSATLTLKEATITENEENYLADYGAGIYAYSSSGALSLNIVVTGSNKVSGLSGIYAYSAAGTASVTVSGSGSLIAEGSNIGADSGIFIFSGSANAELTITGVDVTATNTDPSGRAIRLQPSASASATLAVNSGSLTASGAPGIDYQFGTGLTGNGTPSLTVSGNAIVRVNGKITNRSTTDLQIGAGSSGSNGGIVFDGTEGTVYGDVTLQEDLEIGEGESLTIGDGANLNTGSHEVIVNGGTLTGGDKITGTVKYAPTITTESLPNGTVGTAYSQTLAATGSDTITWSLADGSSLPAGLSLDENTGKIYGTPTMAEESTFTVTATNAYGSASREFTLTISAPTTIPVTGVSLDQNALTLTEGDTVQLTATVEPANATNKGVTWSSNNEAVATVDANGKVTAVSAGTATITVTTEDGGFTDTCEVTVTVRGDVPDRPVNIPDTHEIELIAGEGGEAKTNFSNASAGTKITVTATPDEGYELAYITVDGERIDGTTFKMPAHDVTVRVYFTGGALPFADVAEGAWYYDAVSYVYANGLMDGVSASEFAPDTTLTRAMLVTILWRMEGEPVVNYLMPFTDVDGGAWYAEAVRWAASEGIVTGVSDTSFAPNAEITREQLAAILWRYAKYKGYDVSIGESTNILSYADFDEIGEYAIPALQWACGEGIISGRGGGILDPRGTASRAEAAAMLQRFAANAE